MGAMGEALRNGTGKCGSGWKGGRPVLPSLDLAQRGEREGSSLSSTARHSPQLYFLAGQGAKEDRGTTGGHSGRIDESPRRWDRTIDRERTPMFSGPQHTICDTENTPQMENNYGPGGT